MTSLFVSRKWPLRLVPGCSFSSTLTAATMSGATNSPSPPTAYLMSLCLGGSIYSSWCPGWWDALLPSAWHSSLCTVSPWTVPSLLATATLKSKVVPPSCKLSPGKAKGLIKFPFSFLAAAASAKSLQSWPTLCDPIDSSPPGSAVPGILQARTLEWVAISFSNAWKWKVKVKSLSCVQPNQAPPSMGFSRQEYWSGVPLPSPSVSLRANQSKMSPWHQFNQVAWLGHWGTSPGPQWFPCLWRTSQGGGWFWQHCPHFFC